MGATEEGSSLYFELAPPLSTKMNSDSATLTKDRDLLLFSIMIRMS